MKKTYILFLLMLSCSVMIAQTEFSMRKFRREMRAYIKAEDYTNAENKLNSTLQAHPELLQDQDVINLGVQVSDCRAQEESRKIFLANKPDTARYFASIYTLYDYAQKVQEISPRKKNILRQQLLNYYGNLGSAGKYFFNKHQYAESQKYTELYLRMMQSPLFILDNTYRQPDDSLQMTELALLASYGNKDYPSVVRYYEKIQKKNEIIYEIAINSFTNLKDTMNMLSNLKEACKRYPVHPFFYQTLFQYYIQRHDYQNTLHFVDTCLHYMPDSVKLWSLRGRSQYNLNMEDSALLSFRYVIELDPDNASAYASIADIYLDKAHALFENNAFAVGTIRYRQEKKKINLMYINARTNYQKAQTLAPDKTFLWLDGLRECYYKLNNGKELKKLEKLNN